MRKGGSKSKGSGYERDVARILSLWWTAGQKKKREDLFWRTAGSGAAASMGAVSTKYQFGDITYIDEVGKPLVDIFNIEVRCGKNLRLEDLYKDSSYIRDLLKEAFRNSMASQRVPLIVVKPHCRKELVIVDSHVGGMIVRCTGGMVLALGFIDSDVTQCWSIFRLKDLRSELDLHELVELYVKEKNNK